MSFLLLLLFCAGAVLLVSYYCYRITFYAKPRAPLGPDEYEVPKGRIYDPHRDTMIGWMKEVRKLPRQDVTITSFDGLKLTGSYYQWCPGAVTELMFHGYRGSAERDLCGGVHRAFSLGHNVLIVDQRTSFRSQGNTITFGINEHRDCLSWIDFAIDFLGKDCRLILTGISMGASTVLMAAGKGVPKNVVGVLADCGYHEAKAIILKHAQRMKLPAKLVYPFMLSGSSSGKKSVSHGIPSSSRYQGPQENTAWRSEFKIHGHQGRCRGDFPCLDLQWRELECSHLSLGRGSDEEEGNLLHFLLLPALQCLEDHHPHLIDGRLRLREGRALVESNLELGFQP